MVKESKDNNRSAGDRVWGFFASVKLSFFLLLLLAALSILGTVIPQQEAAEVYQRAFGPRWAGIILGLKLDDVYHAFWFQTVMSLLAVNLVICSLNRLPTTLKALGKDPVTEAGRPRRAAHSFTLTGAPADQAQRLSAVLAAEMGQVHQNGGGGDDGLTLFAQRGAWSRLGVYLVHLSVLVIFAGAMVGSIWGFAGRVNIPQGQTAEAIVLERGREYPLGFGLRLDKFSVSFYGDSQRPSEYRSDVTVLENGKEVDKAVLRVNEPLSHRGIDFYQSSYGELPSSVTVLMKRDGAEQRVELKYQVWSDLPGGGKAGLIELKPQVNMGKMYSGPVARIAYQPQGGEPVSLAAFKGGLKMPQKGPVSFELLEWDSVPYTGLQVKYDPGVWFVWGGCTLMVAAFFVAFYMSHRKVWISLKPAAKGRTRVEISGGTNKNRPGLTRLLDRLEKKCRDQQQSAE